VIYSPDGDPRCPHAMSVKNIVTSLAYPTEPEASAIYLEQTPGIQVPSEFDIFLLRKSATALDRDGLHPDYPG
jgi:hypothetical protein